jgi:hypothetical protein
LSHNLEYTQDRDMKLSLTSTAWLGATPWNAACS